MPSNFLDLVLAKRAETVRAIVPMWLDEFFGEKGGIAN